MVLPSSDTTFLTSNRRSPFTLMTISHVRSSMRLNEYVNFTCRAGVDTTGTSAPSNLPVASE